MLYQKVYLWNQLVKYCANTEQQDEALARFWRFSKVLLLNVLRHNSIHYLEDAYGEKWASQARERGVN